MKIRSLIAVAFVAMVAAPAIAASDRSSVTHHTITLGGTSLAYTATAGTLILKDQKGKPEASIFYVAYTKDGADRAHRPVTFLYNGGPGAASCYLHMAALGPRRIVFPNATASGGPPYELTDNQDTLLDASDLVFIDAPGTGYSRLMPKVDPKTIYGMDQDVAAFGQFIERYITINNRWNSPKFLLGESYGTPRSAMLVDYLQNRNMIFNGVTLLSSVLDFTTISPGPGNDLAYITYLPTEAAIRWYHDRSPNRGTFQASLDEARSFANGAYAQALMQGDRLPREQFVKTAQELARITGLSQKYIEQSNLRVPPARFSKELTRDQGETTGRLDGRYRGYDIDQLGDSAEYDPSDVAGSGAFQSMLVSYARNELKWNTDEQFKQINEEAFPQWVWTRKSIFQWGAPSASPDLLEAMTTNPKLRVFVAGGWYDMATPPGAAEWTFSHLGLQPPLRPHISFSFYESGHMVYLNPDARGRFHSDLVKFYTNTLNQ